jgi:hypothetical protein
MKEKEKVARPGRFELPTLCLEGRRSIQLSYGRNRIDSKTFALRRHTVLDALTLCAKGRGSVSMSHERTLLQSVLRGSWSMRPRFDFSNVADFKGIRAG